MAMLWLPTDSSEEPLATNVLTVHNVLASATLQRPQYAARLDLDQVCAAFGNSYFNPAEFPSVRIDVRGKSGGLYTISLFDTGKIQSTGGCWPIEAKRAMLKIARKLNEKLNANVTFTKFEIQNILAVIDVGHPISLSVFCRMYPGAEYEPDRFPAARCRIPIVKKEEDTPAVTPAAPKYGMTKKKAGALVPPPTKKEETVTANVFATGKITFTGGKSIESIYAALGILKSHINQARMGNMMWSMAAVQPMPHPR